MRRILFLTVPIMLLVVTMVFTSCSPAAATETTPLSTATQITKTLIPTRLAGTPVPATTRIPYIFQVTTRYGQEVQFDRTVMLEPNDYVSFHTETLPQGIPLSSGVEILYDYVSEVTFGLPSADWDDQAGTGTWKVSILLTDGSTIDGSLGFKAHHRLRFTGFSNFGYVSVDLPDVLKIDIKRGTPPKPIPKELQGSKFITVETTGGDFIKVSDPKIFVRCMYVLNIEFYCCHDDTITAIPLEGRADIPLDTPGKIEFSGANTVTIRMPDGTSSAATLRPSAACPKTAWRMRGKTALGDFEIELSQLKKIE